MRKDEKDKHDSVGGHNNSDGVGAGAGGAGDGVADDDMLDYQTDGVMLEEVYGSGDGERMQLNPSSDFYDDDDDDDNDDGDYYVGDDKVVDDDDDEEPEALPEAKSLVQALTSGSSSTTANRRLMSPMDAVQGEEEEEDMGYDEDDERYAAAAMERPKANRDFMNEEGSGAGGGGGGGLRRYGTYRGYNNHNNNNNYKHNYNEHRLGSKLPSAAAAGVVVSNVGIGAIGGDGSVGGGGGGGGGHRDEVAARESSGNFANDDEDDEDDDDDDGIDDGDGFFNSKRTSVGGIGTGNGGGGNRYFRKNTNDAIKIISTPLGKVGIVYQQTPDETAPAAEANGNKKPVSTFTDFDALSPDPDSSRRLQSSHPKITPVLTADGKVALLYRGDSENSKYEPIRNVTHKFTDTAGGGNAATDNKRTSTDSKTNSNNNSNDDDDQDTSSNDSDSTGDDVDDVALTAGVDGAAGVGDGDGDDKKLVVGGGGGGGGTNGMPGMPVFSPVVPTGGPFILRHPTDSVLPMINRPLSEVLGIKKNQYTHIRIRDGVGGANAPAAGANGGGSASSTEANAAAMPPRTLATGGLAPEQSTNTLHFLTNKVNLADYPTSVRTRTFDFDFSRDNTMLDERTRQKTQLEQQQQQQTEQNTVANEELLSKTEVVNLAIIPHFDEDLERLQRLHEHETRRHHRQRHHRHKQTTSEEDLSGVHCIMQAMMGIAAISTVFGMLGTFFKQRILDQLRLLHW